MKGGFYEVYGNQGMQAMSYQKMGDQMPIVQKYSSDDTMHDSSFTPKRVQGHRFGTHQGNPVIAQRYSNMSPSGQVMPHVVVQDMMEGRPNPLMIEDRSKRMSKRGKRGRGRTIRGRTKKPKVEVIAEADEMNMPQILKFIQMLKDRKGLDHPKKKSKKHKRIELDIRDDGLDDPIPEKSKESEKNNKKKRSKSKKKNKSKKKKAKKAKKSKSQKIKALTKRLKRMKEE